MRRSILVLCLACLARPVLAQPAASTAQAALDRASAAYDYGDMNQTVESARLVVEGALSASAEQRVQALRLLGIGLHLTGRLPGAERAFTELLRTRPRARLDPTSTRPEVVAFFEEIRRRHAAETRPSVWWNFLPPLGQFGNGDRARGYLVLGLEAASLAGAVSTAAILQSWRAEHNTFPGHTEAARTLKTWNHVAVGALAASWALGVADAFIRGRPATDPEPTLSFLLLPTGAALHARF